MRLRLLLAIALMVGLVGCANSSVPAAPTPTTAREKIVEVKLDQSYTFTIGTTVAGTDTSHLNVLYAGPEGGKPGFHFTATYVVNGKLVSVREATLKVGSGFFMETTDGRLWQVGELREGNEKRALIAVFEPPRPPATPGPSA